MMLDSREIRHYATRSLQLTAEFAEGEYARLGKKINSAEHQHSGIRVLHSDALISPRTYFRYALLLHRLRDSRDGRYPKYSRNFHRGEVRLAIFRVEYPPTHASCRHSAFSRRLKKEAAAKKG